MSLSLIKYLARSRYLVNNLRGHVRDGYYIPGEKQLPELGQWAEEEGGLEIFRG